MAISRRNEMPQQPMVFCEVFYVWGIDFMGVLISWGHSPSPRETLTFYLSLIIFQDGWRLRPPELMRLEFDVSKAMISDQGSHFCNCIMATLLEKYGVVHKVATTYHPQTNGQVEELEELRLEAYENSQIYKEKIKAIVGKLHSRWDGPFVVTNVFPYGAVELRDKASNWNFMVNGHQLKPYYEGPSLNVGGVESIALMELAIPKDILEETSKSPHEHMHSGQCFNKGLITSLIAKKTMIHLNLGDQRSFGFVLGVGSTISVGMTL
ncbi:hypothetical protein CR513_45679, partial [Mucuna pruriens]